MDIKNAPEILYIVNKRNIREGRLNIKLPEIHSWFLNTASLVQNQGIHYNPIHQKLCHTV